MAGVKIPVQAQFDGSDIDKVLSQLTQDVNKLGSAVGAANKVKFNPIDKATMTDLQKVQAQFDSLLKISSDFKKRLKDTGQSGADFFNIDFSKMYSDPNSRARQMRKAFEYVTAGTGASFREIEQPATAPKPGGGGSGSGSGGSGGRNGGGGGNNTPASTWGSAGRKILGSGLRAMGGAGGAAAGAIESAAGGIAGPMILANLIAQGVSAVVGAVKAKIGAAQQLDVGYDTLKRQLGDVGVGFEQLKVSLKDASWGFGATYEETLKVADAFAHAAGTFGKDARTLAGEVAIAGGFARSFGIDPARSAAFFGQMRQTGVTSDENGSKRLALMIGETVAKSGASAKMDQVLEAIAGFTQQQTRMGMAAANVNGFLGEFAGLAGSHTPGTDAQSIANLLSTVNAAIQHGGNAGDAGRNFMYMALGKHNGLDPIMTAALEEQGMFGTVGGAFGASSAMARFGKQYGVRMPSLGASSGQTNFSSIMASLKRQYANNPELMLSAMSNMFGISINQSAALASTSERSVTDTSSRLSRLGLDLSKVNATGIERLTAIGSNASLSDAEKDRQFKEVYDKNQQKTEGTEVRDAVSGVQKAVTDMADKMVPLTTSILNGITYMAGGGKMSQRQVEQAINKAERDDNVAQINAKADAARKATRAAKQEFQAKGPELYQKTTDMRLSEVDRAAAQKEYDRLKSAADTSGIDTEQKSATAIEDQRLAARNKSTPGVNPTYLAELAQDDKDLGLAAGTSQAMMMTESRGDASATNVNSNGTVDRGMFQINSDTMPELVGEFQKKYGRSPNPYDPEDSRQLKNIRMRQMLKLAGGDRDKAIRMYHGGPKTDLNSSENDRYMGRINANMPSIASAPVPSTPGGGSGVSAVDNRKQWFAFEHNITLQYPNGQPAAPLAQVTKEVGAPRPAGT